MSSSNRTAVIAKTHKILKKHFSPITPVERPVLEQLLYACCLEDNRYETADEGFARVQESFYDWNEVRVTSVRELAELLKGANNALSAATNLKHTLHSVFESIYEFNLDVFKKQNLGVAVKALERFRGTTPFTVSFVVQSCFGGHSIPICKGSLEVLYVVGVISEDDYKKGAVPGLERAIPKTKGIEFGSLLHQLAAELVASPFGNVARNILLEIEPNCKDRLPKRQTKKKPTPMEPEPQKTTPEKSNSKSKAETKAVEKKAVGKKAVTEKKAADKRDPKAVKKTEAKKPSSKPEKTTDTPHKKKTEKVVAKKAKKVSKKSPTKKLARRKPR